MNRIRHISPISPIPHSEARSLLALGLKSEEELNPDFVSDILAHQGPTYAPSDSASLSQIARDEKRRAAFLTLSILFLLIAAACIYLATS